MRTTALAAGCSGTSTRMAGSITMNALHTLVSRLWRRRGFLALTVAVLGLGLGAALTVLEIADALFWRPVARCRRTG